MKKRRNILFKIDWISIFIYFIITFFGYINLYSVSYDKAEKQLMWIIISFFSIFILFFFKPVHYKNLSPFLFFFTIFLLIGVFFFGKNINGSKSWYVINSISFQPSELSKISTSLMISYFLDKYRYKSKKDNIKIFFHILFIIITPSILIFMQPDPGSSIIFSSFILILYRERLLSINFIFYCLLFFLIFIISLINISYHIVFFSVFIIVLILFFIFFKKNIFKNLYFFIILLSSSLFISYISPFIFQKLLKPYHKDRINILFLDEFSKKYRGNIGYNLLYSKTAIGSGRLLGKGYKKGIITKGKFVPEQHTDYIFCTVGEEWGFLGSSLLIIFYLFFIGRILFLSEKQKNNFRRIFGYSVGGILLFHFVINLSMVMGLFPTIGIVLPFFSYGGSSLWSFTILVFLFIRMDAFNKSVLL